MPFEGTGYLAHNYPRVQTRAQSYPLGIQRLFLSFLMRSNIVVDAAIRAVKAAMIDGNSDTKVVEDGVAVEVAEGVDVDIDAGAAVTVGVGVVTGEGETEGESSAAVTVSVILKEEATCGVEALSVILQKTVYEPIAEGVNT